MPPRLPEQPAQPPPSTPPPSLVPDIEVSGRVFTPQELSDTISQRTEDLMENVRTDAISIEQYKAEYEEIQGLAGTLGSVVSQRLQTGGIIPNLPKGVTIYDEEFFNVIRSAPPEQQMRFLFWQDPKNPDTNPWRVHTQMLEGGYGLTDDSRGGGHKDWWDQVKDSAGDAWGTLVKILDWPSEQVEFHLSDMLLRDSMPNAEARRIVADRAWRLGFSNFSDRSIGRDLHDAYLLDVNLASLEKVTPGKVPFSRVMEASEQMNWTGIIGDLANRIVVDPLWLVPPVKGLSASILFGRQLARLGWATGRAGGLLKGAKVGTTSGREITILPRAGRLLAGGPAAGTARQMEKMLSADLFLSARGELNHAPGFFNFLFRRTPQGLGIETMRVTTTSVLEPWMTDVVKSLDSLPQFFDDVGKATGRDAAVKAVAKNGWDQLAVNPETSRFAQYLKTSKQTLFDKDFAAGADSLRKAGMSDEFIRRMTVGHVFERHAPHLTGALQAGAPRWYNKVVRPFAAAQKRVMSVLALSSPRFITLNIGYNGFIGLISLGGKFPRRVLKGFQPFQKLAADDVTVRNIVKVGGDPAMHDQFVANTTFLQDILGKAPTSGIDFEDAQKLVDNLFGKTPAGVTWSDRLSQSVALPVRIATNFIDMPTRRLVYGKALEDSLHFSEDFLSKGGLLEELPRELKRVMPGWASDLLLEEVRGAPMTADGVRAAVRGLESRLASQDGIARVSANMLKNRYVRDVMGVSDEFSALRTKVASRDFTESADLVADAIKRAPGMSADEFLDEIGIIRDMHYSRANIIHEINQLKPVVSKGPGYEKARVFNVEAVKQMVMDEIGHVERLVESAFGGTIGRVERGQLLRRLGQHYSGDLSRVDDIWHRAMAFELDPKDVKRIARGAEKAAQRAGRAGRVGPVAIEDAVIDQPRQIHRLTGEGGQLDYRLTPKGAHLMDINAPGRGQEFFDELRRRVPGTITGDLNTEAGARLFTRQPGARFTEFPSGRSITPDEAVVQAAAGKGPRVELPAVAPAFAAGDESQAFVRQALRRAGRSGRQNILKELDAHYAKSLKSLDDLEGYVVGLVEQRDWVSTRIVKAFFQERRTARVQHIDLIKQARKEATQAGTRTAEAKVWEDFGTRVGRIYENMANSQGNLLFGWGPNQPSYNLGRSPVERTGEMMAFKAHQQDSFLEWAGNFVRKDWDVLSGQRMDKLPAIWREGLDEWATGVGAQRAQHALGVKVSAYERAAYSLTSYERQYGWDAIMQVFAPFEFFPSRILWNWGRRMWDNPAAVGMLWKFARSSNDASEMMWKEQAHEALMAYGLSEGDAKKAVKGMKGPNKFRNMVPIPMPFLSQIPGIGNIIKAAGVESLGQIGWIDPLAYTNPMEFYAREFYEDERKKATVLGRATDWVAQNTPFGPSPLWTQMGAMTGLLPERQAWTNTLISGMPFGLPATRAARGLWSFMGNGNDLGEMSDGEKEFLVNNEYLPESLLRRVVGLPPGDEWEGYLIDRTMASLLFTGDLDGQLFTGPEAKEYQALRANRGRTPEEQDRYMELREVRSARAAQSLKDRSGAAYAKARMQASRERGLRDVSGWAGARISPFLEGDLVAKGLKVLHDQAAQSGTLSEFYDRYPEYQLRNVALANFDREDGEGRDVEIDNTLYWFDRNRIEAMYEEPISELQAARQYIEAQDQLPEVVTALKDVKAQQSALYDQMNAAIEELEEVYPLRKKEMSLFTDPKAKALRDLRTAYFEINLDPGIADKSQQWDDLEARQEAFLSDLPPRQQSDNARDWWDMKITILREKVKSDNRLTSAYDAGRFSDADRLKTDRDRTFEVIHEIAAQRVTRYDFELFLNGGWKKPTANQVEFQRAQFMFDWLMALIGDDSPLSGREKAGVVDAYVADPTFQKYFGDRFIDPFESTPEMLADPDIQRYFRGAPRNQIPAAAIARRREIYDHYGNLDRGRPRVDYLRSVLQELNTIQRILGLEEIKLVEPSAPKASLPWLMPTEDDIDGLALSMARGAY